jgi:AbrB family looped-hinge helix DNA binding protein
MLGVTTIGERGQVVIPADARKLLGVSTGDRFVVFGGTVDGALLLVKGDAFNSLASRFLSEFGDFSQQAQVLVGQVNSELAGSKDR